MAAASVAQRDVEVTLTLTQEEALYVYGALNKMSPVPADRFDGDDPVYEALAEALKDAGVDPLDGLSMAQRG